LKNPLNIQRGNGRSILRKRVYASQLRIYFDNRGISVVNINQLKQLTTNERGEELQ